MKRLGSLALLSALASLAMLGACENTSRLDKTAKNKGTAEAPAASSSSKADHSGSLEERVARLEDSYAKYAEPLDWLGKVYAQQKQQQQAQERSEPAPDAVFAVDVGPNIKLGMVEGPNTAPITIVEAWDFA
jgi:hypothetical protein